MDEQMIKELRNVITSDRFVNLHSPQFSNEDKESAKRLLSSIKTGMSRLIIDIDIQQLIDCENQEQETEIVLNLINQALAAGSIDVSIPPAISIADALYKLSEVIDRPAVVIFHFFDDIYDERQKDILRYIRVLRGLVESFNLGVLIVSDRPVTDWTLFPESDLDERHLSFFEYI